jgi:hypothetical protein
VYILLKKTATKIPHTLKNGVFFSITNLRSSEK